MSKSTSTPTRLNLKMTRTIHPVGQGAFYSETFSNDDNHALFTAVYDCGGRKAALSRERNNLSRVDIIFLSHFHSDHFSGLLDLKNKFDTPKVVIPCVSPCRFLVDYVHNSMKDKTGKAGSFMLSILPIIMSGQEGMLNETSLSRYIPVKTGEKFTIPTEDAKWEYIAFYDEDDAKEQNLLELLKNVLELPDYFSKRYLEKDIYLEIVKRLKNKTTLSKVRKAYAKVFKNGHNSYSMLVLSHEIKPSPESEGEHFDCLYTGDSPHNRILNKIKTFNPDYLQVPHHGSNYNFLPALYQNSQTVFISVGESNRYHHPGLKTLTYLYATCKKVHVVTEDQKVRFVSHIVL